MNGDDDQEPILPDEDVSFNSAIEEVVCDPPPRPKADTSKKTVTEAQHEKMHPHAKASVAGGLKNSSTSVSENLIDLDASTSRQGCAKNVSGPQPGSAEPVGTDWMIGKSNADPPKLVVSTSTLLFAGTSQGCANDQKAPMYKHKIQEAEVVVYDFGKFNFIS